MRDNTLNQTAPHQWHGHAFLTQRELASRWRLSERTLEKWRQQRRGPAHLHIGGRVRYAADEIAQFETENLRGGR